MREERQHQQEGGAGQRDMPEYRVQQVDEGNVDGHPGRVEQRQDAGAAQKVADVAEVAQRLGGVGPALHGVVEPAPQHGRRQRAVEPGADADQDTRADEFEQPHQRQRAGRDQRQP